MRGAARPSLPFFAEASKDRQRASEGALRAELTVVWPEFRRAGKRWGVKDFEGLGTSERWGTRSGNRAERLGAEKIQRLRLGGCWTMRQADGPVLRFHSSLKLRRTGSELRRVRFALRFAPQRLEGRREGNVERLAGNEGRRIWHRPSFANPPSLKLRRRPGWLWFAAVCDG